MNDLHALIFAYRSDARLRELTQHRNTCSIPYGGRYRVIDFMLSSMVNAGVTDVGLIVHANYQSLLDHLGSGKDWDLSRKHGGLRILPPFGYGDKPHGADIYNGRMDALAGVQSYIQKVRQDYVILAGGDIAVNLPVADIFEAHLKSGADITAVCTRVPRGEPGGCSYLTMGADGRVVDVAVKPVAPAGCECLDVYVLSKELLMNLVSHCVAHNIPSFSVGVMQAMCPTLRIMPYVFDGYVARMQTVLGYYQRSMDLLDPAVRADLFNPDRPIRTKDQSNPSTYYGAQSRSVNSLVSDGCIIEGAVENCIISRGVVIEKGAEVSDCVLMQGTVIKRDVVLKHAITDKNVTIEPGRMLMGHENYPIAIAKNAVV